MIYIPIIDIHTHIWRGTYDTNKYDILKTCFYFNLNKVFVSALGSFYPDENEINELNMEVYNFKKEHPNLIDGFCYVNPLNSNCLYALRKGVEEYGLSGMKLWVATYCDDPRVYPLIEKCIEYDIPVLIHSFHKSDVKDQLKYESTGINVANLAAIYPSSKIIMAHLGGNCYHGIKAIRSFQNVLVDTSGTIFRSDDLIYSIKQIGVERILFGTDMHGASFLTNLGQIEEASLTDEQKDLILYKNARKLLSR